MWMASRSIAGAKSHLKESQIQSSVEFSMQPEKQIRQPAFLFLVELVTTQRSLIAISDAIRGDKVQGEEEN